MLILDDKFALNHPHKTSIDIHSNFILHIYKTKLSSIENHILTNKKNQKIRRLYPGSYQKQNEEMHENVLIKRDINVK